MDQLSLFGTRPPTPEDVLDLRAGLQRKKRGLALASIGNEAFIAKMRAYAVNYSNTFGKVTADDVRCYAAAERVAPSTPHAWGAIFRAKGFVSIGWHQSRHARNNGHAYRVWKWIPDEEGQG